MRSIARLRLPSRVGGSEIRGAWAHRNPDVARDLRLPKPAKRKTTAQQRNRSAWIRAIDRIIAGIVIPVETGFIPNGISLHETPDRGRVNPGFIIIHADLRQPHLAGILKAAEIARARIAELIIVVDAVSPATTGICDADNRASIVRVKVATTGGPRTLVPDDGLVRSGTEHVAPDQIIGAVVDRDQLVPFIIEAKTQIGEVGYPAQGIVPERTATARRQGVFVGAKGIAVRVEGRQAALRVIRRRYATNATILVQTIGSVYRTAVDSARPSIGVIGSGTRADLIGWVVSYYGEMAITYLTVLNVDGRR